MQEVAHLPVSAIPTTSAPESAGAQVHAWIGVGTEKPAKHCRSVSGIASCANARMGGSSAWVSGLCIVMECSARKAAASAGDAWGPAGDILVSEFFFFLFSFSALGMVEEDSEISKAAASSSRFRFLFFLSLFVAVRIQ